MTAARKTQGTLALVGGGEWSGACRDLDEHLLASSGTDEVVVLPTAAAFEHAERAIGRAEAWFGGLGAKVKPVMVLNRRDGVEPDVVDAVRSARFCYLADGSPMHLRSVLKDSPLFDALLASYRAGGVLAASGAGATVLCDPMVDPRGGAYTVGLGVVRGLAVFPYHGSAAAHLRVRSVELLPRDAVLAGIDEHTALVRASDGGWRVVGPGCVTLYRRGAEPQTVQDSSISTLKM
jgi:cyanophycinase